MTAQPAPSTFTLGPVSRDLLLALLSTMDAAPVSAEARKYGAGTRLDGVVLSQNTVEEVTARATNRYAIAEVVGVALPEFRAGDAPTEPQEAFLPRASVVALQRWLRKLLSFAVVALRGGAAIPSTSTTVEWELSVEINHLGSSKEVPEAPELVLREPDGVFDRLVEFLNRTPGEVDPTMPIQQKHLAAAMKIALPGDEVAFEVKTAGDPGERSQVLLLEHVPDRHGALTRARVAIQSNLALSAR